MFLIQPCRAQGRAAGLTCPGAARSASGVDYKNFRLGFFAPKKVAEAGQARGDAERQLFLRQTPGLLLEKISFSFGYKGLFPHGAPWGRVTFTRDALSFFFCYQELQEVSAETPPSCAAQVFPGQLLELPGTVFLTLISPRMFCNSLKIKNVRVG